MRSGVQGLDGFEFVVVKIQNCQIRAGGQICYLCDALKIKWTVFSSYFERDYVTGFIYNLCRKIMLILNTAHTAPVVWLAWFWQWRWVSRWSQAPCSSPGYLTNVLLTPSSTCSPSRIMMTRAPVTLSCVLCPPCVIVTLRVTRERQTRAIDKTYRRVHKQTSDMTWRKHSNKTSNNQKWPMCLLFISLYLFYVSYI